MNYCIIKPLVTLLVITGLSPSTELAVADTCPKTQGANNVFGKPWPQADRWFGSESLAVILPKDGVWPITRPDARIAVKLFWWSAGFEPGMESNLDVTIVRLDDGPNDARATRATNARADSLGGWTMLSGIHFQSAGCWKITGKYLGQTLTFVVETV